jgi:hypothetical protein
LLVVFVIAVSAEFETAFIATTAEREKKQIKFTTTTELEC